MNKQIKDEWVWALRFGSYEQGEGVLRTKDDKFCCLGVLCDIAVKNGVIPEPVLGEGGAWAYDGAPTVLPLSVAKWAEMPAYEDGWGGESDAPAVNPVVKHFNIVDGGEDKSTLAELNDAGYNFPTIASLIENNF